MPSPSKTGILMDGGRALHTDVGENKSCLTKLILL